MEDFSLIDQEGDSVLLSDYCGQVVYLQLGAMWCPTCRAEAEKFNEYLDRYEDEGLVILNLLSETPQGEPPNSDHLKAWANLFELTLPVLADTNWEVWDRYFPVHATPRAILVDREGRIQRLDYVISEDSLAEALAE